MDNTQVGTKGKESNQPDDVAKQGIDALLDGKDHVYGASSMMTKAEGMSLNFIPGAVKCHARKAGQAAGRKEISIIWLLAMGGYAGGQAQYARVPFANVGPLKIESDLPDEKVLFLSDILPTGYMAAENAQIQEGDTVAVWGCGPVGQFAIASALDMKPLLERIEKGQIDPTYIISHRITLAEAPEMYKVWRDKQQNVTKIVIDPWAEKKAGSRPSQRAGRNGARPAP
jgi:threonine dehydrogenase-like Zn-dependent dehydrogenase